MIILNVFLLLCSVYLGIILLKIYRVREKISKIPRPPGNWLIGNAVELINTSPEKIFVFLRTCAENYWPIYRFSTPYVVSVNILHPADFEIVLSSTKHLTKSPLYKFLNDWLGEGLLTSTDSKWQKRRKILTPAFHFTILQQFLKIFNQETDNLCEKITLLCENGKLTADVVPLVTSMTLQSIIETSMGMPNTDEISKQRYKASIYKIGKLFLSRIIKPWLRFSFVYSMSKEGQEEKETVESLHSFTLKIIKEREKLVLSQNESVESVGRISYSGKKLCRMLDILLIAKIKEKSIDIQGIREEVDTFMFEGHDTTTVAISYVLLSLANEPLIQEEVRKEIMEVMNSSIYPSYQNLQEMQYTERVIKECLRLYPSVPFVSRVASEDFVTYTGYSIPKGTILNLHIFDLHRNPRLYPDPLKFDPNRFLPEKTAERHPFAYLPFSAGPRNCIGQKYAMLEIKSVICGILRKFQLEAVDKPKNIHFVPDLVLRANVPVRIKFISRNC